MDHSRNTLSSPAEAESSLASPVVGQALDLSILPPIFVSATHFETEDLHEVEDELMECNANLTFDLTEARIVISKVTKKRRIQLDLRGKGLWTEEVSANPLPSVTDKLQSETGHMIESDDVPGRRPDEPIIIDDSDTVSEGDSPTRPKKRRLTALVAKPPSKPAKAEDLISVVELAWLKDSRERGKPLPLEKYVTIRLQPIDQPEDDPAMTTRTIPRNRSPLTRKQRPSKAIIERAKEDAPSTDYRPADRFGKRKFGQTSKASAGMTWEAGHGSRVQRPHLLQTTTSEYSDEYSSELPQMPDWVRRGVKYACQRATPRTSPNEAFIALLKQITLARLLTNDEIGVRAYSTSMASLAAYPYKVTNPREILALPGCDVKIANLWVEWKNEGHVKAVDDLEADEDLNVLKLFYDIWGVGATTAREFYYERGWRDLDDIVEFGWSTLTRVQQIGVKYYDEFLDLIPRAEVERIGKIVREHAAKVRDDEVQCMIVGGYRRGKEASGDVDVIVSHPDESQTLNIVNDIVASLEEDGWITHTLLLSLNGSHRGQQTLPFRTGHSGGGGFDTLDKALVVWQDPDWPSRDDDLASNPKAKNPNIHRRVDIIVSPWRTVGCAVTGWSGGTTFQRDLRRYAKNVKGWKFDSSGVRSRTNGEVVDLEGWHQYQGKIGTGKARTMEQAERRVFEGMGLEYQEPWNRCTG